MNLYDAFKTDANKENKDGVVLNYGGVKIRVLRAGGSNQKYFEAVRRHSSVDGEQVRVAPQDDDAILRLAKVYADAIIVGWENVTDREGNPLAFTKENVIKVLTDLPELFADLREASLNMALFREKYKADLLGKSEPSTAGG